MTTLTIAPPAPARDTAPDPCAEVVDRLVRDGVARADGTAYRLELRVDADELLLGTAPTGGVRGCLDCARLWRRDTSSLLPSTGARTWLVSAPWARTVSAAVADHLSGGSPAAPGRVRVVNRSDGTVEDHGYLDHPDCGSCAPVPSRTAATPLDLSTPQPATAGTLRVRPVETAAWTAAVSDRRHGPLALSYRDEFSPLALVTSEFVAPGHRLRESGYGRSTTFPGSTGPALLEGIERVLGARRPAAVDTVRASARELGTDAVDLTTLGLHDPALIARAHGFTPWTPELETSWVAASSALRAGPVLVPEQMAYWRVPAGQQRFVYESSNGCAVGGSLEEAALHGYYEVVERDAFLLTWYSRTRLPRIAGAGEDPQVGHLLDTLRWHGLTVDLLDMTSDHGVPTALAVITAPDEVAEQDLFPSLSLASATHPDGRQAIRTALEEVATNVLMYQRWKELRPSVSAQRCRPMLEDHDLVEFLEDHTGLHGLVGARPLNEFLRHPAGSTDIDTFCDVPVSTDVAHQLGRHLDRLAELGGDLIVVDQTDPTFAGAVPVHAAKVLVPGSVPMTFGHLHRRLHGLPRLHRASALLKGGVPWSTPGQIVPAPHPFP